MDTAPPPLYIPFDNSYASLPDQFYSRQSASTVSKPELIAFNRPLADLLGITGGQNSELAEIFGGNKTTDGAEPLSQLYAGHQFGQYNPQLGDGRAILLGETIGRDGQRRDIQLKGSGRTPYSRGGDGRAWLGPVLREYVVSEAMHALGIPTTRALAAVLTGEQVIRESVLPGAVLTRVAQSHIRVGTFQVFSARKEFDALRQLLDYTIARHFPETDGPLGFLKRVIESQARLIPQWMGVGFIHGVMNTDNCQIAGETIDYGPCAFMDSYQPMQVFSSIDQFGRYAFGNQPDIIVWNMAQLATALVPLMPDAQDAIELFTKAVHDMVPLLKKNWIRVFSAKIGISDPRAEDEILINDLLNLMAEGRADFTNTFTALGTAKARDEFLVPDKFDFWEVRWMERITGLDNVEETLSKSNPILIPRNHRIEQMIQAAVSGDYTLFQRLSEAYSAPFTKNHSFDDLRHPPNDAEIVRATFCGT